MAKSNCKACHQRRAETENKKQLRIQIKRHWMLYLFPPSPHRLAAWYLPCADGRHCSCFLRTIGLTSESSGSEWADLQAFQEVRYITGVLDDH